MEGVDCKLDEEVQRKREKLFTSLSQKAGPCLNQDLADGGEKMYVQGIFKAFIVTLEGIF